MSLKRKTPKRVYNFNLFYNFRLPLKNTQKKQLSKVKVLSKHSSKIGNHELCSLFIISKLSIEFH